MGHRLSLSMKDPDDLNYTPFIGPQQRDNALSGLRGILQGFISDREFHPKEVSELRGWQIDHGLRKKIASWTIKSA